MQLLPTDTPRRSRGPLSTKNGTFAVAAILVLIAGAALLVFLQAYKDDLTDSDPVQDGAITDPDELSGEVVAAEIHPGHQLQSSDFEEGSTAQARLSGTQRAM